MVYFGKKQSGNLTNYYTKTEADNRYAKLSTANTFSGANTFNQRITSYKGFQTSNQNADILSMNSNNEKTSNIVYKQTSTGYTNWCNMKFLWTANDTNYTNLMTFTFKPDNSVREVDITTDLNSFSFNKKVNFKDDIVLKNSTNNNGAFLSNFQYQNQNFTSFKFVKNNSTALMILETNNDANTATISSPNTNNNLSIKNLKDPTEANDAANKAYVDNRVKLIEKSGFSFTRQVINNASGNQVIKYYGGMNYTTIGITNTSQIISCYLKSIPSSGQHLVVTFFGEYNTDNLLIEIYQYNSANDITNDLNRAIFRIGYINS